MHFVWVGDGRQRREYELAVRRVGLGDRVHFAGLVPPEEVPAMVSAMDVVVHASLREGLARVLVQALLCEKPVVTYALDGAPEVIIDGETGTLVRPGAVDELADALLDVIEHPDAAGAMAREGRRRFADRFRLSTMVDDTARLYRELLAQ